MIERSETGARTDDDFVWTRWRQEGRKGRPWTEWHVAPFYWPETICGILLQPKPPVMLFSPIGAVRVEFDRSCRACSARLSAQLQPA